jgi:hypothetical protein
VRKNVTPVGNLEKNGVNLSLTLYFLPLLFVERVNRKWLRWAFRVLLHCERADMRDALHAELKALRKTLKLRQRKKITEYDDDSSKVRRLQVGNNPIKNENQSSGYAPPEWFVIAKPLPHQPATADLAQTRTEKQEVSGPFYHL